MPRASGRSDGAAYTNVQRLNDDLLIAQRTDQRKGTWYLHKLGRKWVRRSLNTDDVKLARSRAYEAYRVWQDDPYADWLAAIGSTRHHLSFEAAAQEWLATQAKDHGYKAAVIRKFLVPYFHDVRGITDIANVDDAVVGEYRHWRLNFWKEAEQAPVPASIKSAAKQTAHFGQPSAATLNREAPTLRQILAYAERKGCFRGRPLPEVPTEPSKPNPRPAFLGGDFDKLASEATKWIGEADTDQARWRRQLLADWISVGRHTGIRLPHEAAKLTWGDIRLDTKLMHIAEDTKTGRRDVPLNNKVTELLKQMRSRRVQHAKKARQRFTDGEHVFVLQDGTQFKDLGKLFNQLIERCGFPVRTDGSVYSPYSLRHTFATFALAEGMTGDHVAEMMGTSVKMLKDHYKHGTIDQTRRYLEERGLLSDRRTPPVGSNGTIQPPEELPAGDWRRKKLVIGTGRKLEIAAD